MERNARSRKNIETKIAELKKRNKFLESEIKKFEPKKKRIIAKHEREMKKYDLDAIKAKNFSLKD